MKLGNGFGHYLQMCQVERGIGGSIEVLFEVVEDEHVSEDVGLMRGLFKYELGCVEQLFVADSTAFSTDGSPLLDSVYEVSEKKGEDQLLMS